MNSHTDSLEQQFSIWSVLHTYSAPQGAFGNAWGRFLVAATGGATVT